MTSEEVVEQNSKTMAKTRADSDSEVVDYLLFIRQVLTFFGFNHPTPGYPMRLIFPSHVQLIVMAILAILSIAVGAFLTDSWEYFWTAIFMIVQNACLLFVVVVHVFAISCRNIWRHKTVLTSNQRQLIQIILYITNIIVWFWIGWFFVDRIFLWQLSMKDHGINAFHSIMVTIDYALIIVCTGIHLWKYPMILGWIQETVQNRIQKVKNRNKSFIQEQPPKTVPPIQVLVSDHGVTYKDI